MSTYYQYQDVSVMIAHKLMSMEGWEVYGYHADESDSMTDYYSPAYWNGIAEKNGYILVYNESREAKPEEIRKYNHDGKMQDISISDKIQKLQQMTVERGASEAEAETARNMIEKLQAKQSASNENFVVVGVRPGYLANPPKCNWHIEKDGIIIAKGNGLLKYSEIDSYYKYTSYMEDMQLFRTMDREAYKQKLIDSNMRRWNDTEERSIECAESHIKEMESDAALMNQFESFINKIDTTCGALLGSGDGYIYEKITVTEYKKENKAVKTETGSIKDGQCFILNTGFNYGRYKGLVYRIREVGEEGQKYFIAYKLNGKLTKECTGNASQNNRWYMGTEDRLTKWIEKGAISWCEIQEVKTPYEVEKVVKKSISNTKASTKKTEQKETKDTIEAAEEPKTTVNSSYTYDITEEQEETTETARKEENTMKFEANYTSVSESTARTAKTLNSFSDYKEGTATAEQKHYTDAIVEYANKLLEKHLTDDTEKLEKVQYYIDSYSKKIASAIDKSNRIDSMCPSVMICGAGNFPTRRKEKQVAAMDRHYQETKYLYNTDDSNYYFKKIRTTLTDSGIIKSDDKNAVQMIKNKIERLEAMPDTYGNNKAEIRRLKGRLLQLAPDEMKKDIEITINGKEATFENIVTIFNEAVPEKSRFADDEKFYLSIPLCFSNGKRKYNEYLSNEVNADCTMLSTYGNRENDYKTIWKPLTDELKFMLIINKISGSGNKAVIYSILKDLLPKKEVEPQKVTTETEENTPFKVVENTELMRLQLFFDGIPEAEIRNILKSNGFKWAPSQKAWQRMLNDNAKCSLERVKKELNIA